MATNPVGKGTKTIGINMPLSMATEVERRAASMSLSLGAYVKLILNQHFDSGKKLHLEEG